MNIKWFKLLQTINFNQFSRMKNTKKQLENLSIEECPTTQTAASKV